MKAKEKVWIKNPYSEGKMKATLGKDGKLRISKNLFKKLPEYIKVSFDPKSHFLHIAESTEGDDISYKKHNTMTIYGLIFHVVKENISHPICFTFRYSYDKMNSIFFSC